MTPLTIPHGGLQQVRHQCQPSSKANHSNSETLPNLPPSSKQLEWFFSSQQPQRPECLAAVAAITVWYLGSIGIQSLSCEQAVDVVAQLLLGAEGEVHVTIIKLQTRHQPAAKGVGGLQFTHKV